MRNHIIRLAIAALAAAFALGCNKNADLGQTLSNNEGASIDAEIKRIEEDPNMPDIAKQNALAQLRARQQAGQNMSEAMQKGNQQKSGN